MRGLLISDFLTIPENAFFRKKRLASADIRYSLLSLYYKQK